MSSNEMICSAARCWWMFRYFGHEQVYLLNGGLEHWKEEGRATESGPCTITKTNKPYKASAQPQMVVTAEKVLEHTEAKTAQILDARPPKFFHPENPTAGQGHIPSSLNVPFASITKDGDFNVRSRDIKTKQDPTI